MISISSNTVHVLVISANQFFNEKFSPNVLSNVHGSIKAKKIRPYKRSRLSFLREILSFYLDHIDPSQIILSMNNHGKPQLTERKTMLRFNISHTDEISLCALSKSNCSEIGVDIEKVKYFPYYTDVARTSLTSEEFKLISGLPRHKQLRMFYKLWSIKESCSKGIGLGQNLNFKFLNIDR